MALTIAQVNLILSTIQPVVDVAVLAEVKQLLQNALADTPHPGDPYDNIKQYSITLLDNLRANSRGICCDNPDEDNMAVFMDKIRVQRLLNKVPAGGYIAALPGIHKVEGTNKFTVSLLAADSSLNIMEDHCNGNLHGEETWKDTRTFSDLDTLLP